MIVKDVLARLRVILWCSDRTWASSRREIDDRLSQLAAGYWSKSVLRGRDKGHPDGAWQEQAWSAARRHEAADGLRMLDQHLSKAGWFDAPTEPPWELGVRGVPPFALFYSFKGGAGRSTALAVTALHLAAAGERSRCSTPTWMHLASELCSPGTMAPSPRVGSPTTSWNSVFWANLRVFDTEDYCHRYAADGVLGAEEIIVCPAGHFDRRYMEKLARIDYGESQDGTPHPFVVLLERIREDLSPGWILIDARAGLGEVSGMTSWSY